MYASWRNFRLALKSRGCFSCLEKISTSAITGRDNNQKSPKLPHITSMDMFRSPKIKNVEITAHNESDTSFPEREDSGFINEGDLPFNGCDLLFSGKSNFTVSVEGNIGSGKTTLLEYFTDSASVDALPEPIEQWTNIQGQYNALQLLYEDPKRWSFSFNMYAQLTRVQMHMKQHIKPIKMLERSLHSTRHCFVENDYRNKTINGMEYGILTGWYDWLVKSEKAKVDLIVYVRADPEVSFDRIKKRSRKEEALVPFSLIEDLHNLHEEWLIEQKDFKPPAPVVILDANKEYDELKELYETHRQEILCGCV